MTENAENATKDGRSLDELLLAGLGWVSMTAEAADELADDLARRVGIERDEMRGAVRDMVSSWRTEADRLGVRRSEASDRVLQHLGLARREVVEDLSLRVAQLEHRLKLLERPRAT